MFIDSSPKTVLLVEPDPEACAVYTRHLAGMDLTVITCGAVEEMLSRIERSQADLVIVNPTGDVTQCVKLLTQLRSGFPKLPVITIGGLIADQQLDQLMAAGVTMHINRYLTHPRDLHLAIEQVLS